MGRHSQRHFAASLPGRSFKRRSPFAVAAALAAVAISTTAGAASLVTSPGTAPEAASTASVSAPAVASVAGASATTPEEQTALDAASTELVRAEFLAGEGASRLTPDQLAQITATRDQLRQLVSAATTTDAAQTSGAPTDPTADAATSTTLDAAGADDTLDGRDTFRASRAGSEGREALTTDGTAEAATDETSSEAALADAAATGETAAAPATDEAAAPAETPAEAPAPEAPTTTAEVVPSVAEIDAATIALRGLLDATAVAVAVEPAPPTADEIAAQQAAERAAMAQQLAAWAASTAGYANGTIPANLLCAPSFAPGELVRCDAAYQLEQLNAAYVAAFGTNITVTSSYRSYASQVAVKAQKGFLAAAPGTSNHGMAQALDLGGGISSFGSAQYSWMRANAPAYGWENPEWARQGGSKPEAWHWEYGVTY
ncbi:D-alanyl-D-alanine carboxypeptidase family protein [Oerskovia enterophila]